MPLTAAVLSTRVASGAIPGLGFVAIVQLTYDSAYLNGGEYCDLSAIFPNTVYGGTPIADTADDGGWLCKYVAGASPTSGLIQVWGQVTIAAGTCGPLNSCLSAQDISAMNAQVWVFYGR